MPSESSDAEPSKLQDSSVHDDVNDAVGAPLAVTVTTCSVSDVASSSSVNFSVTEYVPDAAYV